MGNEKQPSRKAQHQDVQPGIESVMDPKPIFDDKRYIGTNKLKGKVALITGGDSGIGRAVAVVFAKEGATVVIAYLNEHEDAEETKRHIEKYDARCLLVSGDLGEEDHCKGVIEKIISEYGQLDIVVNNIAEQHPKEKLEEITAEQLEKTFRTNVFSFFYITKAALPHLKRGSTIINTTSITAYEGHAQLLDYSATKGAIVTFTRSMSQLLADDGIRVNAVAPGPIWTPLIPSTFSAEKVEVFGNSVPLGRAGEPYELAAAYVYLASSDSSYVSGQAIHINGGVIVNG